MKQLRLNQTRQAKYYDRTAKDLPPLDEGDTVRMKPFSKSSKIWKKAMVTQRLDERSYLVQSQGEQYRRNREHLKKTHEETSVRSPVKNTQENNKSPQRSPQRCDNQPTPENSPQKTPPLRRSNRKKVIPAKFADYVKK